MPKFKFVLLFAFLNFITIVFSSGSTSYNYLHNGADWTEECKNGTEQSPIDINTDKVIKCDPNMMIDIRWSTSNLHSETENLLVTYKTFGNWSTLYASDYDGDVYGYDASQFHFHSPSEHTINGAYYDLEIHIVHSLRSEFLAENPKRNAAVIGILFTLDDSAGDNPFFVQYDPTSIEPFTLNMSAALGSQIVKPIQYYHYLGSLTTPPCSEIVNWYVLANPLKISSKQLAKFTSAWSANSTFAHGNGNNRIIMPANGRSVKIGGLSINACKEDFVSFFGFFVLFLFLIYVIFQVVP